jgi:sporulation integral membrane protein YtvI
LHQITQQFLLKTFKFIIFWLIFGLLFFFLGKYVKLFAPLILGLILFGIMNPIVKVFERHTRLNRKWSVAASMVLVISVLGSMFTWFTFLIIREVEDLMLKWPSYLAGLKLGFANIWPKVQNFYFGLDPKVIEKGNESLDTLGAIIGTYISKSFVLISGWVFFLPELFIIIVIALVSAFFITKDWKTHKGALVRIFPNEWRTGLGEIGSDFSVALVGFLRAQLILVSLSVVFSILGLYILGARYAFIAGLIAGLFGILPVLGAGLVLVPWAILEFIMGNVSFAVELLALVGVMSILRHIVEPKILGDNVGLDPLFVMLSMYIGLESIGPIGLLVGPFVVIAYKSLQKAGVFKNL